MSVDCLISPWQKPNTDAFPQNITINHLENDRRSSTISTSSSSSSEKSSRAEFLQKLKYFEHRNDHTYHPYSKNQEKLEEKSSLRSIIAEIRSQFSEDDFKELNETSVIPVKRPSKEFVQEAKRLSKDFGKASEVPKTQDVKNGSEKKVEINEKKSEVKKQPRRKTLVTVQGEDPEFTTVCAKFFSTSDEAILMADVYEVQNKFRIMLKGHFYDNAFSLEISAHCMKYYLHDFFDYDLSMFELEDDYF